MDAKVEELKRMAEQSRERLHELIDIRYDEFINILEM